MKKLIIRTLILTFIFTSLVCISAFALSEQYQTVKIGLYYGSSAKAELSLSSSSGFEAGYMNGSVFTPQYAFAESTLSVRYESSASVNINGTSYSITGGNFALSPISGTVNIAGSDYRGGAELLPAANGNFTVINFVDINDYIAAVVGKEMSPSWHIEALKAQAVCARTYAIATWNRHSSHGFNLCGTQDCQAYMGISGETESTVKAAAETEDLVIKYNGNIIEALYSSSNGGSSASSKYVWGNDIPYLVAVKDDYEALVQDENPRSSWSVTLTKQQIKDKLAANSIDIGDITDFKVTGADEYGRTYKVTVYGTNGTYDITNDRTRAFFGFYSQRYTITPPGGSQKLYALSSSGKSELTNAYVLKGASAVAVSPQQVVVKGSSSTGAYGSSNADGYVINGSGWGHGLGMSQYGAKAMAEQGMDYEDIITFYYQGTYIE